MLNNYEQIVFSFIIIIFILKNICFWFKSLLAFVFPMIGMPNMDQFWDKMDNFKRLQAQSALFSLGGDTFGLITCNERSDLFKAGCSKVST